jgi:hypothetical protein
MQALRLLYQYRALAFLTLLGSSSALAQNEKYSSGLDVGLTNSCKQKDTDFKNINDHMNGDVPQGCRDQITSSVSKCWQGPMTKDKNGDEITFNYVSVDSIKGGALDARAANVDAQGKYAAQSESCSEERDLVKKACSSLQNSLQQAIHNNNAEKQNLQSQLSNLPATYENAAARDALSSSVQNHNLTNQQLNSQVSQTHQIQILALKALNDAKECFENNSKIYEAESQRLQQIADQVSSNASVAESNTTPSQIPPVNAQAISVVQPEPAAGASTNGTTNVASDDTKTLANISKSTVYDTAANTAAKLSGSLSSFGPATAATVAGARDDYGGMIANGAQQAVSLASKNVGELVEMPLAAGAIYFSSTVSTSPCADVYTDAVQAYNAGGCTAVTPKRNEAAIATLSAP